MTNEELWQTVLAQIQLAISAASFATWFKQTAIIAQEKGEVTISVPNSFSQEWLKNKYHKLLFNLLNEQDRSVREIKYVIGPAPRPVSTDNRKEGTVPVLVGQMELQDLKIDHETNLNPRYLFENFVVGGFNEMAHAAAVAVAKAPGREYNPLFVYGGVGVGKTHLLQAAGNEILKNRLRQNIKYLPAERFTSEIVAAIRNRQIEALKTKLQKIDVLILDDVQFLAGKEKTQEEFFHLFNALYEKNKQIILSSDRPPKAINLLSERLRSRFEGGTIVDIGVPDLETKIAILKNKAVEKKANLSDEVLTYVAQLVQKNIRELEGALNRLIAQQKIVSRNLSVPEARELLASLAVSPVKISSPRKIIQAVSDFYDLREKEIFEENRKKEVVKPRQIIMFLLREDLKYSFPAIGRFFKGKDHTTAIHAFRKIQREVQLDEDLAEQISLIRKKVQGLAST